MVVYFVILFAINFGPAPKRMPALSRPGIFGTGDKFNLGSVVLKLGSSGVPNAFFNEDGPPNVVDTWEMDVGMFVLVEIPARDKFEVFVTLTVGVNEPKDNCGDDILGTEEKEDTPAPTDTVFDVTATFGVGELIFGMLASNSGILF